MSDQVKRELKTALALLLAADDAGDPQAVRRLVKAAAMHIEHCQEEP